MGKLPPLEKGDPNDGPKGLGGISIFHMLMIFDMLLAVSVLPCTVRAVAEIHPGVALVGDAADRAAMERRIIPPGRLS